MPTRLNEVFGILAVIAIATISVLLILREDYVEPWSVTEQRPNPTRPLPVEEPPTDLNFRNLDDTVEDDAPLTSSGVPRLGPTPLFRDPRVFDIDYLNARTSVEALVGSFESLSVARSRVVELDRDAVERLFSAAASATGSLSDTFEIPFFPGLSCEISTSHRTTTLENSGGSVTSASCNNLSRPHMLQLTRKGAQFAFTLKQGSYDYRVTPIPDSHYYWVYEIDPSTRPMPSGNDVIPAIRE